MSKILLAREGFSLLKSVWRLRLNRAWRAFCRRCSSESVKFPGDEMRVQSKYSLVQCLSFHCLCENHNHIFFVPFWKTIILVFLGLILSILELKYEDNLFWQFCSPNFDRDNIIRSSA